MARTTRRTSREKYDDHDEQKNEQREYFDSKSPPKKSSAVDTKTVGLAGILMFLMTNFKKEIGQILTAISTFIGGGS